MVNALLMFCIGINVAILSLLPHMYWDESNGVIFAFVIHSQEYGLNFLVGTAWLQAAIMLLVGPLITEVAIRFLVSR